MKVDYVKLNNDAERLASRISQIKSTKLRTIFADIKKLQMSIRLKVKPKSEDKQTRTSNEIDIDDLIKKTLVLFRARLHYNAARASKKEKKSWDELKSELDRRINNVLQNPELFEAELADFMEALLAYHKEKSSREEETNE